MEYFLVVAGIILLVAGIAGCVLPGLAGPPLSFAALLLLHFTERYQFSSRLLIIWGVVTLVVTALDYLIPIWGAKQFGASKRGIWGSIIGLVVGLFFPPVGIILGPFAGAVIGELTAGKETAPAIKAGLGSFVGLLAGILIKLVVSGLITWLFLEKMITG